MPAERFYIDAGLDGSLTLEGTEFHHLAHVMRARVGDSLELVNGKGSLASAKITALSKHNATLLVLSATTTPVPPPKIILAIPLMRPSKLELVIEKCTELGADAFWLYPAHHSEKESFPSIRTALPHRHLGDEAMRAARSTPHPTLRPARRSLSVQLYLSFGDTREGKKITHHEKVVWITGPEKGFSEEELKLLDQKAIGVKLHRNILRAETAPIAALCIYAP